MGGSSFHADSVGFESSLSHQLLANIRTEQFDGEILPSFGLSPVNSVVSLAYNDTLESIGK